MFTLDTVLNFQAGNWTDWSQAGACVGTCGTGTQTWTRSCTNPSPCPGGESCIANVASLSSYSSVPQISYSSGIQIETKTTSCSLSSCDQNDCSVPGNCISKLNVIAKFIDCYEEL